MGFQGDKMNLVVNGKTIDTTDGLTVSELLVKEEVKMPEMVSASHIECV